MQKQKTIHYIVLSAIIAAAYVALTFFSNIFGLAYGSIQLRISEVLTILPVFTPAAIPGVFVGCILSNLLTGCLPWDVVFGSLATLIGALGARLLRRWPALVPLPTVVANTLIVPFVLAYGYGFEGGVFYFMATVGIGEILSAYLAGLVLYYALKPYATRMFNRT